MSTFLQVISEKHPKTGMCAFLQNIRVRNNRRAGNKNWANILCSINSLHACKL